MKVVLFMRLLDFTDIPKKGKNVFGLIRGNFRLRTNVIGALF